jgi:hypothetical protein
MVRRGVLVFAVAALALATTDVRAQDAEPMTCEEARCAFQQEITARCSCDSARNHGQYVKCVGRVIREITSDGRVAKNCRGKLVRCAARSTCGKDGFVTCNRVELGTCDLLSGTCVEPAGIVCTSDTDCVISTRCNTKRSAEICEARGGVVGDAPTCCSSCVVETPAP